MQNLLCKLLGHKWRDATYWEFKRENGKDFKRKVVLINCTRCREEYPLSTGAKIGQWEDDKPMSQQMLELGNACVDGLKKGLT